MSAPASDRTRWAVLGPGAISSDFVTGLRESSLGVLHAVGSSNPGRAATFAAEHGAPVSGGYDLVERDDVDAVYIGTVHTTHADLAVAALAAGKAVLCEKPISVDAATTDRVLAAAAEAGRPFLEAYKYRFGPLWATLLERLPELGAVHSIRAQFGFSAGSRDGRLFDPAVGGGAILDVGGYPVSLAIGIAGTDATVTTARGTVGAVDEDAEVVLQIGATEATLSTAITRELPRHTVLRCELGTVEIATVWGSRTASGTSFLLRRDGKHTERVEVRSVQPMAAEADAVSLALAEARSEIPEMPWAQSAAVARVLEQWRAGIGATAE